MIDYIVGLFNNHIGREKASDISVQHLQNYVSM